MADPTPVPAPGAAPVPASVPPAAPPAAAPAAPLVTFDEFKKMDLRIGKILSVEDHSNANKLYVLKIDIGNGGTRQVVAGIKPYYAKEALVGRSIVVICNLQPAMLRGVESQGMLLAASGAGSVVVLAPEKDVPPGSKVS
jgi:methionyl-tRNA synthetase